MNEEDHKEFGRILIHAIRECWKNEVINGVYCLDEQVPKELKEMTINDDPEFRHKPIETRLTPEESLELLGYRELEIGDKVSFRGEAYILIGVSDKKLEWALLPEPPK